MTAHDPSLGRTSGGLLGWLGLGPRHPHQPAETPGGESHLDRRDGLRQRQLDEVVRFLTAHQLEVSTVTLTIAWNYLTGADSQLVRSIDRQVQARKPVTLEWIDQELGRQDRVDEMAVLADLMQRLETSIDEFGKASRDAHVATSEYHSALEGHVNELEQVTRAGEVISELANIAKVMLRRTREIEKQMLRSEAQTRALRRRLDEARRSAEEDHLTGLPNRRAFEAVFEEEFRLARASAETLCVAFCDIDHFKKINDEHGHEAGDRVLKLVADAFARISNDHCHVARHGGEEFVLLLRGETLEQACAQLDHLREQLASRRLVNRANDRPFGQVTFSAGVADVFRCGDPRSALRAADSALYRAKQEGRNRVAAASEADCQPPELKVA
ncbi:GGDEF domain-containing protein [Novosphingobium sp.]|uniref:GGDEF domain-containing protein n=1 Tax=Novosphingobium sp. TaxID=1874826 RepID=UPI0025D9B5A6|nr:GGDEF domain-containing protein [Novosphingobium sp.]MCC6925211.1 GGDEF domain-containing protein [Novosphingobium sp.]